MQVVVVVADNVRVRAEAACFDLLRQTTPMGVFPNFGLHVGLTANLGIWLIFTAAPIIPSRALRRAFNALQQRRPRGQADADCLLTGAYLFVLRSACLERCK